MRTAVVIADAARARFFHVAEPSDADYKSGPRLREHEVLINPEAQLTGAERHANVKSGRRQSGGGGQAHGVDDRRGGHERKLARRFAKRVAMAVDDHLERVESQHLLLVAPPVVLGEMRRALGYTLPVGVRLDTLDKELSWHALPHIEKVLERHGLLEARVVPADVYRPRGQAAPG